MKKVASHDAWIIGDTLGVNWSKYKLEEFRRGLEVEQEHLRTVSKYAKAGTDPMLVVGMTVIDHLDENPNYYTLLAKVGL